MWNVTLTNNNKRNYAHKSRIRCVCFVYVHEPAIRLCHCVSISDSPHLGQEVHLYSEGFIYIYSFRYIYMYVLLDIN